MKSFWNIFVHKALDLFDARSIVEIGSDDGLNTKNLLAFVKEKKAQLHVVDPAPKYIPNDFFEEHQGYSRYYKMLSLNFLASHDVCDAYLIDGDHNWYTVYNELKLIDKKVRESKKSFPLIMFHDTGWPYARRDLYYNPENIPPAHINPYKRFGILPNQAELIAGEGLNDGCAHSIYEGTPHNGVLTAIEDFLDEAQEDFIFINFSVKFGFSLLVERNVAKSNPAFFDWICDLQNKTIANDIMSFIELERTTALIEQVKNEKNANIEMKLAQDELAAAYTESHELRCASDAVQEKLYSTQTELQQTQVDLAAAQTKVNAFQETIERAMCEVGQLQADLAVVYTESNELRCARDDLQENLYSTQEELQKTQVDLAAAQSEGKAFQETIERTLCEVTQLQSELVQAQNDLTSAYIDAHRLRGECEAALGETSVRAALEAELTQAQDDLASAYIEVHSLHAKKDSLQGQVNALHNSLSWAVTAPLRLVYDVLAAPFRAVANFNLRRTLHAFRYSLVGNKLYSFLVPQKVKNRINRAWTEEMINRHESEQQERSSTREKAVVSVATVHEPIFIPDPAWYEEKNKQFVPVNCPVKILAFYLPQFHPIPENDEWWGEGFTEWTNVTKAKPLFDGHHQPRLPGAMGFYDLRLPDVLRKQAALAKEFGVYGFCFHHYYFGGKRLLEAPVNNLLENPDIDLPFCLCWANENWTRRWDGQDQNILIAQEHSPEDDIRFLEDIQKYFDDPRYIQVDGKPFLIIYKASQFPDMAATICRWREHAAKKGGGIYLVMAQTFGENDPSKYGFDAAVEFPPHCLFRQELKMEEVNSNSYHRGHIYDARKRQITFEKDYKVYNTLFTNWDNTARKGELSDIFISSPAHFKHQLDLIVKHERNSYRACDSFVFINAWNEWAEGTYLEPDKVYGYAYLNAISQVLNSNFVFGLKKLDALPIKKDACAGSKNVYFDFSVIIPVYNGVEHLKKLIECLLNDNDDKYKIIFVDDCSTDVKVKELIDQFMCCRQNVEYYRNASNKGFSFSVNYGASKECTDFIILNTDTSPVSGWTQSMLHLIRENYGSIASVTPFSNSATIFSFPVVNEDNTEFSNHYSPSIVNDAASKVKVDESNILAPTGVGFCMAINRKAWDQLGGFDEKTFGKGYGEEVDWCRRAINNGWKNVIAPNVFVAHYHGGSFTPHEKQVLLKKNQVTLEKRWPTFAQSVLQHMDMNPWEDYRIALIVLVLLQNKPVLIFDHSLGGGANLYAEQKIKELLSSGKTVAYLTFHPYWGYRLLLQDAFFRINLMVANVKTIFSGQYEFSEFIINSFVHWTSFDLDTWGPNVSSNFLKELFDTIVVYSKRYSVQIIFLLHDYYCICPSYNLLNSELLYCGIPDDEKKCNNCLKKCDVTFSHKLQFISQWRETWNIILNSSAVIEVFSTYSQKLFLKTYPQCVNKILLNPHKPLCPLLPIDYAIPTDVINIACVGTFNHAKGACKINALYNYIEKNNINARIYVIGDFLIKPDGDFYVHGKYKIFELPYILKKLNISAAFVPSIWPETFNYISSELIQLGLPTVCFDYGAQRDKVSTFKYGVVVKNDSPEEVILAIKTAIDMYAKVTR